ncbi:hypothetical protein B1L11_22030 [Microbispora sp. GKU 823]|nr:hypothetical protein B1L11_22030 [Microbispora sp. GKU 823]
MLWAAAALTAVAPTLYFWIVSILAGDYGSRSYISTYWGSCLGWDIYDRVSPRTYLITDFPLFSYGGAPLIVLGCAGWYLSLRSGRARLGRIIGRCVAAVLLVLNLPGFLLPTLDAALGPACLDVWGPPELFSAQVGWGLYDCLPPVLVLLAVRAPRRVFVRRGPVVRTTAAVLAVTAVVLLPAASAPPGKVNAQWELGCPGFGDGTVKGLSEADKRFLCAVRYDHRYGSGLEEWNEVSDEAVLDQGRHLCALATRHGGDIGAAAVQEAPQASLAIALPSLCPAVARAQQAEEERWQAESDAYVAREERACAADLDHLLPAAGFQRRAPGVGLDRHAGGTGLVGGPDRQRAPAASHQVFDQVRGIALVAVLPALDGPELGPHGGPALSYGPDLRAVPGRL